MSVARGPPATDRNGEMTTTLDNPYLRDAVMTATPEQLQLMLYDGAIRLALQARDAIEQKDYESSFNKLTKAQNIVLEMQTGLNFEVNRPLCERMAAIYNFIYRKLIDANVQRNVSEIDDALKILRVERETWRILVDKVGKLQDGDGASPSALAGAPEAIPGSFSAEG